MTQFTVDEDLAALVWTLAKPRPFENLSFSSALRRVLQGQEISATNQNKDKRQDDPLLQSVSSGTADPKKAPTPSPTVWVASVPDLKGRNGLHTWKAVCNLLKIDTAGDSARRKLKNWVKANHPNWPHVPDTD